jgi:probable F420-dependent oxidoreductase
MNPFRFSVHTGKAPSVAAWRDRAKQAEDLGYSALYITDHFDDQFGPLVAATVAAEATSTLHVGTLVLNNDLRQPVVLAKEIASLGLVAEGRIELGLGAGWLKSDYAELGIAYDEAAVRVERLSESLTILRALLSTGEATFSGRHYAISGARCEPRSELVPRLMVGGGSRRVLSVAAQKADIVGITLSNRSGEHGTDVGSRATLDHYERCLGWVKEAAGDRFDSIELQIDAFATMLVPSRRAARTATMLGLAGEDALDLPSVLIGEEDELCERLQARRERWGFSNIVIQDGSMEAFAPVVARLTGS